MKNTALLLTLFFSLTIFAQQANFNALPWQQSLAYNSYLMYDVHSQYRNRDATFEKANESKTAMEKYIADLKKRYSSIAGQFPARAALNARVVKSYETGGIRIENIVFESVQGRYVTANLYLPAKFTGKIPAALEFCGHGLMGKYGSRSAAVLALNGIAVLVVDPLGQGERLQLIDSEGNPLTRGATTEHTLLNAGLNLLGTSLAAQEFYDNSRALDYLLTRSDIDAENIGVYGSSGGGTQSAYYVGLDSRVKVAAICSYFSQRERILELQGASDGCQHIPYEGREALELADFALMQAPKPLLILAGKYDIVDLWGAQQGFANLQKAYKTLGVPEKVDMLTVEAGHGLGFEKQQRLISWFRQWLIGKTDIITSEFKGQIPAENYFGTEKHQVNISFPDAKSLMDENIRQMADLQIERDKFLKSGKNKIEQQIRELLGLSKTSPLQIVSTGQQAGRDYQVFKYQLIRKGEMVIPCVLILPDKVSEKSSIRLILTEKGKNTFLAENTNIVASVSDGTILLAADLRGLGETVDPPFYNDAKYWNFEYRNAMTAMHIGKAIVGQRVQDILSIVEFCATQKELKGRPISIKADGIYGIPTLHAAVLDSRIASAEVSACIRTWKTYLENPMQYNMYSNVIYGVLRYYDLPDLVRLSERRARFAD